MIMFIANCEHLPASRPSMQGRRGAPAWSWAVSPPTAFPTTAGCKRGSLPHADKSNIKIFLPNSTFNERNCRRKIAEENCVWLLTQKVTLHHLPHLPFTWVLTLNGPEKPIAPLYIFSFVLCIHFLLSKSSWLMVSRKKQVMGGHCLPKRASVQVSHLLVGKFLNTGKAGTVKG